MKWLYTHPYTSALCAAGVLTLIGAFIVASRASEPATTQVTAWGGGAVSLLDPTAGAPAEDSSLRDTSKLLLIHDGPPYTYTAPSFSDSPASGEKDPYSFEAFIAVLTKESSSKNTPDTNPDDGGLLSAYAYIPSGLISTTSKEVARTELQESLYRYGNETGSDIESFEQQHPDAIPILKAQVEDRADKDKAAAVVEYAHALQNLGNSLVAMENVPSTIASAHKALAQSYIEIGKNLALVPQAERDSDFIAAIQKYNASADTFTKNYIQLISLFSAHGVIFTPADSGRVFTFSPSGF